MVNYIAHAATVRARPGENSVDVIFAVFLAITFPFSGVARGLEAIVRRPLLYRPTNDLQTAVRAGALCIVIRDKHWTPDVGRVVFDDDEGTSPAMPDITTKRLKEFPTLPSVHGKPILL